MTVHFGKDQPLEILTAGEPSRRPPLLFVHGAFCGAWIWAEHFLPFFAEAGFRCVAVSLSGHGRSVGRKQLDSFGLADYVADVAAVAAGLDPPPVIVGHSMGGVVAQRFVQKHPASGLILLASASFAGLGGALMTMALTQPALLLALTRVQSRGVEPSDTAAIRKGLFSESFPVDRGMRYAALFQRESMRANLELMVPQWLDMMGRPRLPALALGGADDCFVPWTDVAFSSLFWNAETHRLAGVPHAMMLDSSWRVPARIIADWLARTFGPK
jgi:pimeloyl-ACP methyl ester carboxylesterase